MSSRRLLPRTHPTFTQGDVIDSIGNSRHYRNPFRVDLPSRFPGERDERMKEHEKLMGTQDKGFAEKGRPI